MDENTPALWCDECQGMVALEEHAFYQRGYWWCLEHVRFFYANDRRLVAFPSPGKLIPATILHEIDY